MNAAKALGLEAKRAWGSNGESLGEAETVDLMVAGWRIQAKRVKKLAKYLVPPEGCDIQVFREDHGAPYAVIPYEALLELINGYRPGAPGSPTGE